MKKIKIDGKIYTLLKVRPFGTVDVMDEKGNCFRISGLYGVRL